MPARREHPRFDAATQMGPVRAENGRAEPRVGRAAIDIAMAGVKVEAPLVQFLIGPLLIVAGYLTDAELAFPASRKFVIS